MKKSTCEQTAPTCRRVAGGEIWHGDNLPVLQQMKTASIPLIYIDPPFNTGKTQSCKRIKTKRTHANGGDRNGFGGHRYQTTVTHESGYADKFDDYLEFLRPRLTEAYRILTTNGSLFFHIDWRESARCRLLLEEIFGGSEHCINEIIWAYDFGARSKSRWPTKHDNIYWFAKNPSDYIFNYDHMDRIPYMAPGLVGKEKTGYPTQKPIAILKRIVQTHSHPGDTVLDFFAGSGTTGEAADILGREFVLIDENPEAVSVMESRLGSPHKRRVA